MFKANKGEPLKAIIEVQVLPLGTCSPGVSKYIKEAIRVLEEEGVKYFISPMATAFECEDLNRGLEIVRKMHERVLSKVDRVVTVVRIDQRKDKDLNMEEKIEKVKQSSR